MNEHQKRKPEDHKKQNEFKYAKPDFIIRTDVFRITAVQSTDLSKLFEKDTLRVLIL